MPEETTCISSILWWAWIGCLRMLESRQRWMVDQVIKSSWNALNCRSCKPVHNYAITVAIPSCSPRQTVHATFVMPWQWLYAMPILTKFHVASSGGDEQRGPVTRCLTSQLSWAEHFMVGPSLLLWDLRISTMIWTSLSNSKPSNGKQLDAAWISLRTFRTPLVSHGQPIFRACADHPRCPLGFPLPARRAQHEPTPPVQSGWSWPYTKRAVSRQTSLNLMIQRWFKLLVPSGA